LKTSTIFTSPSWTGAGLCVRTVVANNCALSDNFSCIR
jgi:hypothetical protein